MRRKSTKQMYLDFSRESSVKVVRKNRAKYEAIDRVLKANGKVVDSAHRDLSKKLSESKGGRKANYTTEQIVRALIVSVSPMGYRTNWSAPSRRTAIR